MVKEKNISYKELLVLMLENRKSFEDILWADVYEINGLNKEEGYKWNKKHFIYDSELRSKSIEKWSEEIMTSSKRNLFGNIVFKDNSWIESNVLYEDEFVYWKFLKIPRKFW